MIAAPNREELMTRSSRPVTALMAAAAACLVLTGLPLLAQQGGERIVGGPPNPDIAARRGVPQRLLAASEDQLPNKQLKLPQGFKVETYISGIADAWSLRIGDRGTVFVGNRTHDKVYAVVDRGGRRETITIAFRT